MELRHLRTIAAVARHRSFTKAGEELHLAQSAISQQIRRLEREIGVEVFHRTSRSVELTAEGRVILDYAHRVIAEVDGLHSELAELTGLLRGQLRIGGVYPTGPYDLFGMLAEFRATHPEVAIHMVEDTQEDTIAALRADELDCAFTALDPDTLGDEFAATLLWEEEFTVALPVGHPLCAREYVTLEELAAEDLIAYRENSALHRRLEPRLRARGLEAAQGVRLHGDGRGAHAGQQGPRRRDDAALGRRGARPADRAAPDRARAADVAGRARLARRAPPDARGQGVPQGRARVRPAHRAPRAARRLSRARPHLARIGACTLREARDFLLAHREDYDDRLPRVPLAGARRVQLGARLVRRRRAAATTTPALWIVEEDGSRGRLHLRRAVGALEPGRRLAARARASRAATGSC